MLGAVHPRAHRRQGGRRRRPETGWPAAASCPETNARHTSHFSHARGALSKRSIIHVIEIHATWEENIGMCLSNIVRRRRSVALNRFAHSSFQHTSAPAWHDATGRATASAWAAAPGRVFEDPSRSHRVLSSRPTAAALHVGQTTQEPHRQSTA